MPPTVLSAFILLINSLIHVLIQQTFVEHLLEASHWRGLFRIAVNETNRSFPPGTFTVVQIQMIDRETHTCYTSVMKNRAWHTSFLLAISIIGIKSQLTFPSCFPMTHSRSSYPPVPQNYFQDFSVFMSLFTQFPLTKYAIFCFLKVLCILHHLFQISPPSGTCLALLFGISSSFLYASGLVLRLLPFTSPRIFNMILCTHWLPTFLLYRTVNSLFPISVTSCFAYINSTGLEEPDVLFYSQLF